MEDIKTTNPGFFDIFGKDEDLNKSETFNTELETETGEIKAFENNQNSTDKDSISSRPNIYKKNKIDKKALEKRKAKLIRVVESNPEAIIMIKPPSGLFYNIQEVNYGIRRLSASLLLRKTNIDLLITGLREIQEKLEKTAIDTWYELSMVYPYASVYNIKAWRILNEKLNEKKTLIENNVMFSYLIIPYSEEIGMLATVTKHMCILRSKLNYYPDEKLAITLRKVKDILIEETDDVLKRIKKIEESINNSVKSNNEQ